MLDPYLSVDDRVWVVKFTEYVEDIVKKQGVHADLNLFVIADAIGLDLSVLHKEGTLMYALWVALLMVLKEHMTAEDFKYKTVEEFMSEYEGWFVSESEKEKSFLWQTANWMHLLFKMITARKNKGLALQVIPKVVEGWEAKYVTGSGQTKATANRVHVFEVEGNTKANQRGKIRSAKKKPTAGVKAERPASIAVDENGEVIAKQQRKKRALKPQFDSFAVPLDHSELGTRSREKRARDAMTTIYEAALAVDAGGNGSAAHGEEAGSSSIASDVEKAYYKLMRDSSCSSVLSFANHLDGPLFGGMPGPNYDYQRGTTSMSLGGLDPLNFITLTGPSELQRGYSWTEIPVAGEDGSHSAVPSAASYNEYDHFEAPAAKTGEAVALSDLFTGYTK